MFSNLLKQRIWMVLHLVVEADAEEDGDVHRRRGLRLVMMSTRKSQLQMPDPLRLRFMTARV